MWRARLAFVALAAATASAAADLPIDTAARLLSLNDPRRIVDEALPYFHSHLGDDSLTPLLRAAWQGQRDKYPGLSWKLLVAPEVRLPLGQTWCQWLDYRKVTGAEFDATLDYARRYVNHASPALREGALSLLGACGELKDLDAIVKAARTDADRNAQSAAVFAIYSMLRDKARPILTSLRASVTDPFVLTRIDAILGMIPN